MGRAILLLMVLAAPGAGAQGVRGMVFEVTNPDAPRAEWRRIPSAGAFAIVHWTGHRPAYGHYQTVCLQAAIGKTDAQGRFDIPEPPMRPRFVLFHSDPAIAVYKPGFDTPAQLRVRGEQPEWSLVRTELTREQRAMLMDVLGSYGCREDDGTLAPLVDPQRVLPEFRRALAAELPAPEEKRELRILQRQGLNPASR